MVFSMEKSPNRNKGKIKNYIIIIIAIYLTLFQLGRDNFYYRDSISRDKA